MTGNHGYCHITTGTVSTTGTQIVMRTPKYRIFPSHDDRYTLYKLQVRRWWGWSTLETHNYEICIKTIEHLVKPTEYFDINGNKIESC